MNIIRHLVSLAARLRVATTIVVTCGPVSAITTDAHASGQGRWVVAAGLNRYYAQGIDAWAWSQIMLCRAEGAQQDADVAMFLSPSVPV